jgi:hypothetical protein
LERSWWKDVEWAYPWAVLRVFRWVGHSVVRMVQQTAEAKAAKTAVVMAEWLDDSTVVERVGQLDDAQAGK